MNRKTIAIFAITFVLIALVISYFVWNYEPQYAESEISRLVCHSRKNEQKRCFENGIKLIKRCQK